MRDEIQAGIQANVQAILAATAPAPPRPDDDNNNMPVLQRQTASNRNNRPTARNNEDDNQTPRGPSAGMDDEFAALFQQILNPAQPVVTQSMGVADHVSEAMKERIWNYDYVDLAALLPSTAREHAAQTVTLSLCQGQNNGLGLQLNKPKQPALTLTQWEDAFLVYMGVYTMKHSHEAPDLCTYMKDIKDLGRRGANFLHYDKEFRALRENKNKPRLPWNSIHQTLHFQATTPFRAPRNNYQNQGSAQSGARNSGPRVPPGYCSDFHTFGKYCSRYPCTYKHYCPYCPGQERHPGYKCNNRSKQNGQTKQTQDQHKHQKQNPRHPNPSQTK